MAAPEHDVITAEVPTVALLEAARAMTEPEPPADLGLYGAAVRSAGAQRTAEHGAAEYGAGEDGDAGAPPASSRISRPALPLAAEYGLEHLLEAEARPARSWSMWLRAHGPWIAAGALVLWLSASFVLHWLALFL